MGRAGGAIDHTQDRLDRTTDCSLDRASGALDRSFNRADRTVDRNLGRDFRGAIRDRQDQDSHNSGGSDDASDRGQDH